MRKQSKSYRKLFNATLATTVAAGAFVAVVPAVAGAEAGTYKDVKPGLHYYEPIKNLSERGILIGYPDGTFKPNQAVTRGQAAKILALALELDIVNVKDPGFTDVKKSNQYYGPIAALVNAGIVKGYDDKTFKPGNELTRSQMAKIINLGYGLDEETLTDTRFTDVKKGDAYAGYVQALISNGITTGTTPTTFSPNGKVTRGQMASFIVRTEAAVAPEKEEEEEVEVVETSVKGNIVNITEDAVELTTGTYKLPTALKALVNATTLAALKDATIEAKEIDGTISGINSIELNASGTADNHVVLDGKNTSFTGDVKVNGDYVTLKGLTLTGKLTIGSEVSVITLDADVQSLVINQTKQLTVNGTGNLKDVTVQSGNRVTFNTTGDIDKLTINSKDAKITLGAKTEIEDLILPTGVVARDVIQDYNNVKKNIKYVNGKLNPDNTSSSGGGGGGGGGGSSEPAGNAVLEDNLQSKIKEGELDNEIIGVSLSDDKKISVTIKDEKTTLTEFAGEANSIFNALTEGAKVDSVVLDYKGIQIPVNDNTDIGTELKSALVKLGLPADTDLSILKGQSFTFVMDGYIENQYFEDTYTFQF